MSGDTQTLSEFEAEQRAGNESAAHGDPIDFDFDFAHFVAVNDSAKLAFDQLARLKHADADWNPHARAFIHVDEEQEALDADESDEVGAVTRTIYTGHFRLSLDLQPARLARGWVIGSGRQALSDPDVDFLVTVDGKRDRVRSRHAQLVFHRKTRVLMLKVPPKKHAFLDGVLVTDSAAALTKTTSSILIGNLAFQLRFQQHRKQEFLAQLDKIAEFTSYFTGERIETVDPTPSDQYFTLHGYQFQTPQAAGAYGVVSACIQIDSGEVYAVKRVKKSRDHTTEVEKELKILGILQTHPHVCSLVEQFTLGSFKVQEMYMILSPYAPRTLTDMMRTPTDTSTRLNALAQIARGLQYIHECGVIHRDLKPDNILVTNEQRVVITDFGHSTTETNSKDHFKGTLQYLAPEIYELKEGLSNRGLWSDRSDAFTFGVVAFEILFRPFRRNAERMIGRPVQLSLLQELSNKKNDTSKLLTKLLAWDVRRRPTMGEVVLSPIWPQIESPSPSKKRPRREVP